MKYKRKAKLFWTIYKWREPFRQLIYIKFFSECFEKEYMEY